MNILKWLNKRKVIPVNDKNKADTPIISSLDNDKNVGGKNLFALLKSRKPKELDALFILEDRSEKFVEKLTSKLNEKKKENPSFNYLIVGGSNERTNAEDVEKAFKKNNFVPTNKTLAVVNVHGNHRGRIDKGTYKEYKRQDIIDKIASKTKKSGTSDEKMTMLLCSCHGGTANPGNNIAILSAASQKYTSSKSENEAMLIDIVRNIGSQDVLFDAAVKRMVKTSETFYFKDGKSPQVKIAGIKDKEGKGYDFSYRNVERHLQNNINLLGQVLKVENKTVQNKISSLTEEQVRSYPDTQLNRALWRGKTSEKTQDALDSGASLNENKKTDYLLRAVKENNNELTKKMLDMGADVNASHKDKGGKSKKIIDFLGTEGKASKSILKTLLANGSELPSKETQERIIQQNPKNRKILEEHKKYIEAVERGQLKAKKAGIRKKKPLKRQHAEYDFESLEEIQDIDANKKDRNVKIERLSKVKKRYKERDSGKYNPDGLSNIAAESENTQNINKDNLNISIRMRNDAKSFIQAVNDNPHLVHQFVNDDPIGAFNMIMQSGSDINDVCDKCNVSTSEFEKKLDNAYDKKAERTSNDVQNSVSRGQKKAALAEADLTKKGERTVLRKIKGNKEYSFENLNRKNDQKKSEKSSEGNVSIELPKHGLHKTHKSSNKDERSTEAIAAKKLMPNDLRKSNNKNSAEKKESNRNPKNFQRVNYVSELVKSCPKVKSAPRKFRDSIDVSGLAESKKDGLGTLNTHQPVIRGK